MSIQLIRGVLRLAAKNETFRRRMIARLRVALRAIPIGTTELPGSNLKIERRRGSLHVFDMTNAGKRGKQVPLFILTWDLGEDEDLITGAIEPILDAHSYQDALRIAKQLVADIASPGGPISGTPETGGPETIPDLFPILSLREDSMPAFQFAPMGAKILLDAPKFTLESTPRDFSLRMKIKSQHEAQYKAWVRSPSHAAQIFKWLKQPGVYDSLRTMDFRQAVSAIREGTGKALDWN